MTGGANATLMVAVQAQVAQALAGLGSLGQGATTLGNTIYNVNVKIGASAVNAAKASQQQATALQLLQQRAALVKEEIARLTLVMHVNGEADLAVGQKLKMLNAELSALSIAGTRAKASMAGNTAEKQKQTTAAQQLALAQKAIREEMAKLTLATIANGVATKADVAKMRELEAQLARLMGAELGATAATNNLNLAMRGAAASIAILDPRMGVLISHFAYFQNALPNQIMPAFVGVASAIGLTTAAVAGLMAGGRIEASAKSFEHLAGSMQEAERRMRLFKDASAGTLTSQELRTSTSSALALGIDPDKVARMLEQVRVLSKSFGLDFKEQWEQAVHGVTRKEIELLDQLGVSFRGMEVSAMSTGEVMDEVLRQLSKNVQAVGGDIRSADEDVRELWANLRDLGNNALMSFAASSTGQWFNDLIKSLSQALEGATYLHRTLSGMGGGGLDSGSPYQPWNLQQNLNSAAVMGTLGAVAGPPGIAAGALAGFVFDPILGYYVASSERQSERIVAKQLPKQGRGATTKPFVGPPAPSGFEPGKRVYQVGVSNQYVDGKGEPLDLRGLTPEQYAATMGITNEDVGTIYSTQLDQLQRANQTGKYKPAKAGGGGRGGRKASQRELSAWNRLTQPIDTRMSLFHQPESFRLEYLYGDDFFMGADGTIQSRAMREQRKRGYDRIYAGDDPLAEEMAYNRLHFRVPEYGGLSGLRESFLGSPMGGRFKKVGQAATDRLKARKARLQGQQDLVMSGLADFGSAAMSGDRSGMAGAIGGTLGGIWGSMTGGALATALGAAMPIVGPLMGMGVTKALDSLFARRELTKSELLSVRIESMSPQAAMQLGSITFARLSGLANGATNLGNMQLAGQVA